MDPRAAQAIVSLEAENAKLRAESKMFQEMAGKATKQLLDANLQVRDMQEIVDSAMNENIPRIRAATKAYQDRQRIEKPKDEFFHSPGHQCPTCDAARSGTEKRKDEGNPWTPNKDYPEKPIQPPKDHCERKACTYPFKVPCECPCGQCV